MSNSVFDETDHPIWGAIIGVFPLVDIKAGMELFMHYDYERSDFPQDFPWYWETKLAIEREERIDKEKNSNYSPGNSLTCKNLLQTCLVNETKMPKPK